MTKKIFYFGLIYSTLQLFITPSHASPPRFHCHSLPNMPVQVYEYSSVDCMGTPKNTKVDKAGKGQKGAKPQQASADIPIGKNDSSSDDGMKDVICAYQAACKVVEAMAPEEPTAINTVDLQTQITLGSLKGSILVCKGRASIDRRGYISDSHCPTPSKCQKQLLYNFGSRTFSPSEPIPAKAGGEHK